MNIRFANQDDCYKILEYDKHISETELSNIINLKRVLIAEDDKIFIGWLRWNLFWDNTPFLNMLFILKEYRNYGYGKALVSYWENIMKNNGYNLIMTSTLSNEDAQHFYRKLNYTDSGSLLFENEPLEIIFTKKL